jgi:hypothetical protein
MCAVVLTRREEEGSTEAPSVASELPPSHGAVKEEATDQLEPVCQGAEESLLVLQLEVPAEAGGKNRVTRLRGAALQQVRRHFEVREDGLAPADRARMVRNLAGTWVHTTAHREQSRSFKGVDMDGWQVRSVGH